MRSSRNQLQGNLPTLVLFQETGTKVTKIEKTGIHFKTDAFAAVAIVDAKAPYSCHKKLPRGPARVQNEAEVQMKQK